MSTETLKFENVAIYRVGMFGVHRTDCRELTLMTGQKYAQYTDAIALRFVEKGKRKLMGSVLADHSPWLRVVAAAKAPAVDDPMEKIDGGSKSRYTSYDMRYVTEFEDKLTASGAEVVFTVGSGHRGECGCGLCAHRMREAEVTE